MLTQILIGLLWQLDRWAAALAAQLGVAGQLIAALAAAGALALACAAIGNRLLRPSLSALAVALVLALPAAWLGGDPLLAWLTGIPVAACSLWSGYDSRRTARWQARGCWLLALLAAALAAPLGAGAALCLSPLAWTVGWVSRRLPRSAWALS